MQKQKEEIRKKILDVAHKEFVSKGVRQTSIKTIAEKAGIAVGNVYRYFQSKDDIYLAICQPVVREMETYAHQENSPYYQTLDVFTSMEYQEEMINSFLKLVKKHKTEFRLLLFESTGTPLEGFFDRFAKKQAEIGWKYIKTMQEKYPQTKTEISPYFVEINCIIWFDVLRIITMNDSITKEDIKLLISNYISYGTGGWKMIFNV
ncbi:MAG: TetR/AcrR family transcriptional regulator [Bacteroidaceae bacterium]|nr:TetR/AcrR family transcriptional regulator [Bacteroidaceae bacterium]